MCCTGDLGADMFRGGDGQQDIYICSMQTLTAVPMGVVDHECHRSLNSRSLNSTRTRSLPWPHGLCSVPTPGLQWFTHRQLQFRGSLTVQPCRLGCKLLQCAAMIIKMQKCPSHANLEPLPESKGVEKGRFVEEKKSWGQAGDFPERRLALGVKTQR